MESKKEKNKKAKGKRDLWFEAKETPRSRANYNGVKNSEREKRVALFLYYFFFFNTMATSCCFGVFLFFPLYELKKLHCRIFSSRFSFSLFLFFSPSLFHGEGLILMRVTRHLIKGEIWWLWFFLPFFFWMWPSIKLWMFHGFVD